VRLAAVYYPSDRSLGRRRFIGLPATFRVFARDALFPSSVRVALRWSGPPTPRFSAGPRLPSGPRDWGAVGRIGHRRRRPPVVPSSACRIRDRASGPAEVASLEVCFPVSVCEPRCAGPGLPPPDYPASTLTPVSPATAPTTWPVCVSSLRFSFAPSRQSFPFRDAFRVWFAGTSLASPRGSFVHGFFDV
jgi:hypothetical protein